MSLVVTTVSLAASARYAIEKTALIGGTSRVNRCLKYLEKDKECGRVCARYESDSVNFPPSKEKRRGISVFRMSCK